MTNRDSRKTEGALVSSLSKTALVEGVFRDAIRFAIPDPGVPGACLEFQAAIFDLCMANVSRLFQLFRLYHSGMHRPVLSYAAVRRQSVLPKHKTSH